VLSVLRPFGQWTNGEINPDVNKMSLFVSLLVNLVVIDGSRKVEAADGDVVPDDADDVACGSGDDGGGGGVDDDAVLV